MPAEANACSVKLPAFEGPLDLLLHLIRTNEVDIYEIPIVEITRQYDEYLALMRELDLHVAGEYLVMAATLLHIKSKTLLPQPPSGAEEEEDPRAGLVRQLIEYEKLAAAAEGLRSLEELRDDVYLRPGDPLAAFQGEAFLSVSLFDLIGALKTALDGLEAGGAIRIEREEHSVAEKQAWILDSLAGGRAQRFQDLLGTLRSRAETVVAFLALLELIRLRSVLAAQRSPAGDILLMLREDGGDAPAAPGALRKPSPEVPDA
jgi:segregation and condensation protein A